MIKAAELYQTWGTELTHVCRLLSYPPEEDDDEQMYRWLAELIPHHRYQKYAKETLRALNLERCMATYPDPVLENLLRLDNLWQENREVWRQLYDPYEASDEADRMDLVSLKSKLKEVTQMQKESQLRADLALKQFRDSKLEEERLIIEMAYLNGPRTE